MATGVEFVRDELERVAPDYQLIADCLEGERAIKGQVDNDVTYHLVDSPVRRVKPRRASLSFNTTTAQRYLPAPQVEDDPQWNADRYDAYLTRAVFYNATRRTLAGYVGQLFQRPPSIEIPEKLSVVAQDTLGERVGIDQLAKQCVGYVLPYGRCGLLVDYPKTSGGATRDEAARGGIRPIMKSYAPWNITNWRTTKIGATSVLSFVVLREEVQILAEDGFELETDIQYRVLALSGGKYTVSVWTKDTAEGDYAPGEEITPLNAKGQPFDRIPFFFIGAGNNDPEIDHPPFLDIAKLNVGHYRNSADYEEACFILGQPTLWAAGLTAEWYEEVIKGRIQLGSRAVLPLPEGGKAGLIQAAPNTMPQEAMAQKQEQLVTLGARIAETPDVVRTATEATLTAVETSSPVLSTAYNVSTVFTDALKVCAQFVGAEEDGISYALVTEATLQTMTPEQQRQLVESWLAGAVTFRELRENLTRAGVTGSSDENEAKAEMEEALKRAEPQPMTKETPDAETEA